MRRELSDTRERVNRQIKQEFFADQYQDALQSPLISQRHGRYVIPIKADHRGAIPGIIHDAVPDQGHPVLEPLAIVEHNNALNLLHNREKREEEAVLRRLTDLVRNHLDELRQTLDDPGASSTPFQAKVDSPGVSGQGAHLAQPGGVDFRQARHPLLVQHRRESRPQGPQDVVPIDLTLTPEQRFLIISGANAGGKTVALKTLGLLTLMAQSGIPIPVDEGSEFCAVCTRSLPTSATPRTCPEPQHLFGPPEAGPDHAGRALKAGP